MRRKSYQLTLAVPSGYAPATLVNTANITVRPITDPDLTNNSATDTDNVTRSADLSITKTDSIDPVNPGQAFTYTLTVTNNGPSDAATLTVSDTVPAQFTVTSVTSPAGACGFARQRGHVHPTDVGQPRDVGHHGVGHHDPRRARRHVHRTPPP